VDAGPVRCEGDEGQARGQHRIRAVVRVRCFVCCSRKERMKKQ